jgi:hypothetical protein
MKVACPNCKKVLQAPDEWAGRKVKCPGCKKPISLPTDGGDVADTGGVDLGSLEAMESAGEALVYDRTKPLTLKAAQAAATPDDKPRSAADPNLRTCPKCGQKARSEDPYSEIICRHCGGGIPGRAKVMDDVKYTSANADRMTTTVSFYTGFTGAATYPIPAMAAILLGMGVALAIIAIPLLGVLGFTQSSSLNNINERGPAVDSASWVGLFLTVMFVAEAIYFGSVGYYILIDTIRTTTSGAEQPPNLTWNIINLGTALGGYAALLGFYAILIMIMAGGFPDDHEHLQALAAPWKLFVIALLTFGVPMNIIGLSSGHAMDGLNPVRVFRSIGRLLGHYIFLFLIVLLYLGMYIGLMVAVLSWAAPIIMASATKGLGAGFVHMLMGVAAWAVVMGLGFYFAYSVGRILGLFSRTYREQIDFEL